MQKSIVINHKIGKYNRTIQVQGDKSISIRFVLLASQAIGISRAYNLLESEDVRSSLNAVKKLGVKISKKKKFHEIIGCGLNGFNFSNNVKINAGNSGTLARLILGLLVKSNKKVKIIGDKSLSRRDFGRVVNPLKNFGVNIKTKNNFLPLAIKGSEYLTPIKYFEKLGSAQVKSCLMIAALNTPGITKIRAKKSRNHTEIFFKKVLKIPIKILSKRKYDLIEIEGLNEYKGFDYKIPGDISSSSFFIILTILSKNSKILIKNVNINQSRTGIIDILKQMKCKIYLKNKKIYKGEKIADILAKSSNFIKPINCTSKYTSRTIDEFLIIFLVAAKANGVSNFKNLSELNKKESPRLNVAAKFLNMIGIKTKKTNSTLKIYGNPNLNLNKRYEVKNYFKDHRVFAMSCIAALVFGGKWKIHDKNSINTSFPNYLKLLKKLGAKIN